MAKRYYEKDGNLANLKGRTVANIGYGSQEKLFGRSPRFDFNEIAKIV